MNVLLTFNIGRFFIRSPGYRLPTTNIFDTFVVKLSLIFPSQCNVSRHVSPDKFFLDISALTSSDLSWNT